MAKLVVDKAKHAAGTGQPAADTSEPAAGTG
jgi:hypothetical protein